MKLNVLLAITDHQAAQFKAALTDYIKFFKNSSAAFRGIQKTFNVKEGMVDDPSMRSHVTVVTTVDEKLKWLSDNTKDYIDALFSQEATNASGVAKARLVVDDIDFGEYTSAELLRLKSILSHQDLVNMYSTLPVREETKLWTPTEVNEYANRKVFEDALLKGVKRTTEKEDYILTDPNLANLAAGKYTPMVATRTKGVDVGDYTLQNFTGEMSHRERADILLRRSKLLTACIAAIKVCNEVEAIPSQMNSGKLFGYLHTGAIPQS